MYAISTYTVYSHVDIVGVSSESVYIIGRVYLIYVYIVYIIYSIYSIYSIYTIYYTVYLS